MSISKLHIITIVLLILSLWLNNTLAACHGITPPTYTPTDALLSVEIEGIKDDVILVNSTFDVTWKSDGSA